MSNPTKAQFRSGCTTHIHCSILWFRSLHLIVEVPIFLSNITKYVRVEVQFRTIAMDFWASLEHEIKYKKNINSQEIFNELKELATASNILDEKMKNIRNKVNMK